TTTVPLAQNLTTTENSTSNGRWWSICDSDSVYITRQPYTDQIFYPGQQIDLAWSLNSDFDKSKVFEVILKRTRIIGLAADIVTWNIPVTRYSAHLIIPSVLEISTRETYFVDFFWWNCGIPYLHSTNHFRIPTAPVISITQGNPVYHSIHFPGDTVLIQWAVQRASFPSGITVKLLLNRERLGPDSTVAYAWVSPSKGFYQFTIPTNIDVADNNDQYYFSLDWSHCSWINTLVDTYSSESTRFYVPTSPYLVPLLPTTDDQFSPGDTVSIKWIAKNFDSKSASNFCIKLRQSLPLAKDPESVLSHCQSVSTGVCNHVITVETSVFGYYYEFDWCSWYDILSTCSVEGSHFQLPVHRTGGWNYNAQQDRATSQISLLHAGCDTNNNPTVARLCNDGQAMSIDLTCTNCYMVYDYSIVHLDLSANLGSLTDMNIKFQSTATVNLELLLSANYIYQTSGNKYLNTFTLLGFTFSLAGISFDYGCFLDLELPYSIELNSLGRLSTGVRYQLNTVLQLYIVGTKITPVQSITLSQSYYPVKGDFKARVVVDVALQPRLRMSAVVFDVAIRTEGFLRLETLFQYPPFAALYSNTYDYNSNKPSLYHWSYPSDACSTEHLSQYHVQFGIRKTLVTFDITFGDSINSFISHYIPVHYETPSLFDTQ
ncbi:unnamed protein product, partial [Adineta ricciae]